MTSMQTLQLITKPFRDQQYPKLCNLLSLENKIVASIDNNQKVNCLTYQKIGSSNTFVKVTGIIFNKYTYITNFIKSLTYYQTKITYIHQNIPSPTPMLPFETLMYNSGTTKFNHHSIASIINHKMKTSIPFHINNEG